MNLKTFAPMFIIVNIMAVYSKSAKCLHAVINSWLTLPSSHAQPMQQIQPSASVQPSYQSAKMVPSLLFIMGSAAHDALFQQSLQPLIAV